MLALQTVNRYRQMVLLLVVVNVLFAVIPMSMATAAERTIRILAYGDSLTAGFGLPQSAAFPVQLERALQQKGHAVEVINAGVSGDTTASGLDRLDWSIPDGIDAAILELGANDALRGLDPARARTNLDTIIRKLKARRLDVLIAGMTAPRNWGEAYVTAFDAIFPDLATTHDTLLYPFFLDGVAMRPKLNLGDGLHPNADGVAEIVGRILPSVEALVEKVKARRVANKG